MGERSDKHAPWWRNERGEWYVVAQGLLFALIAFGPRSLSSAPEWTKPYTQLTLAVGYTFMIIGSLFAIGGLYELGGSNLTALPYPKEHAVLRESGPYAIVRHPIYTGLILGAFGWALALHAELTLLYAAVLFVLFDLKSRAEEKWLCERFPGYDEYQHRVKRLLPWLY